VPPDLVLANRMLALTLELEQALLAEDWTLSETLLSQRELILDQVAVIPLGEIAHGLLRQCQEHEHRLLAQMATFKSSVASELGELNRSQRQSQIYRSAAC
jgi:hypothetical protein